MTRVYVVVEGATEEAFVNNELAAAFWRLDVQLIAVIIGSPGHKGGNPSYVRVKRDVRDLLRQESNTYCSTMLDYYGLRADFPGMPLPGGIGSLDKVERIERAMRDNICAELPEVRAEVRFLPYIQLHEYEGLLFSDPEALARALNLPTKADRFKHVRNECGSPEDINDGPSTAPSKRIMRLCPSYRKVVDGTLAAKAVGVESMRRECPHFREWLERIEQVRPL